MKSKICFIIFTTLFAACSQIKTLDDYTSKTEYYASINKQTRKKLVDLYLMDNKKVRAYNLVLQFDSSYFSTEDTLKQPIATKNLHKIEFVNHFQGLVKGFLFGAAIGGALVLINREYIGATFDLLALGGALISGGAVGVILGEKKTYLINNYDNEEINYER